MSYNFRPSIGNASAFQTSGYPYVTGSVFATGSYWIPIEFPSVTKSFTVINLDASHLYPSGSVNGEKEIFVFFGDVSVAQTAQPDQITKNHYVSIPNDKNGFVFDVKCKKVYIGCHDTGSVGGFQIFAELTNVPKTDMPPLFGAGIDE
jgi:hypothetical protein